MELGVTDIDFSREWFDRLFVGIFKLDIVLKIFDWFYFILFY